MFFNRSGQKVLVWMTAALLLLGLGQAVGLLRRVEVQPETREETRQQDSIVVGTVIRQESVVDAPEDGTWRCLMEEGQRAAAGQALFTTGATAAPPEEREDPSPYERHLGLMAAIRAYQRPGSSGEALKALLTEEGVPESGALLPSADSRIIRAEASGIFSRVTDGLEGVLTPERPETGVADLPRKEPEPALGKLITSDTWYYYTRLPEALEPGKTLEVRLLGGGFGTCRFTVEWSKKALEGYETLLSANAGLEAVSGVRRLWVKILSD